MSYRQPKTDEQIAAERKAERRQYNLLAALNLGLLLAALVLAIAFIVCVFKGNWPFAAGYAILTYAVWYGMSIQNHRWKDRSLH